MASKAEELAYYNKIMGKGNSSSSSGSSGTTNKGTFVPTPSPTPKPPVSTSGPKFSTSGGGNSGFSSGGSNVSSPGKNYNSNAQQAANDIIYWKQEYDKAVAAGNKGASTDWITKQANNIYSQMDKSVADKLRGLNAKDAKSQYDNGSLFKNGSSSGGNNGATFLPDTGYTTDFQNRPDGAWAVDMGVDKNGNLNDPNNPFALGFGMPQQKDPTTEDAMQELLRQFMEAMQQSQGVNAEQQAMMEAEAQKQYQMLVDQLNNNMNFYNQNRDNQLNMYDQLYQQGKSDLEDTSFQDYLAARQNMANRGLAGSGLASDQDTRLLMANDRNLQKLSGQITNQKANVMNDFNRQANEIQGQLKNTNYSDFYNSLLKQYQAGNTANLGAFGDLLGKFMPYMNMTQKDKADFDYKYSQMDQENRQFYDKLGSEEKMQYMKMDNENQQLAAKLKQEYGLKMTELMGKDSKGNPTLDAYKVAQQAAQAQARLYEQNRHNVASESASWARVNQSANEFQLKIAKFNADAIKYQDKINNDASNTEYKRQADGLSKMLNYAQKDMSSLRTELGKFKEIPKDGTPEFAAYKALDNKYNESVLNYNAAFNGLKKLSGNGSYGTDPTRTPMGIGNLQ